ncbi:MAG: HEAT repeat domain-containing protein [Terriglobales bacterium]
MKRRELPPDDVARAIVVLAKPFDEYRISAAKEAVAAQLSHDDAWVRHEAVWFLGSWARLHEYKSAILNVMEHDPDADNRGYAASCIGVLARGSHDQESVEHLKTLLMNDHEDPLIRQYAFRSLLQVAGDERGDIYSPHDQALTDADWQWVKQL